MQTEKANLNMQEFFKQMYKAHDLVKEIKERIDKLYLSAEYISPKMSDAPKGPPNPQRLENTIIEMEDLRERGEMLIGERAKFDLFVCTELSVDERNVLKLRCEDGLSWKEIASSLRKSVKGVQNIFKEVEKKAESSSCFLRENT